MELKLNNLWYYNPWLTKTNPIQPQNGRLEYDQTLGIIINWEIHINGIPYVATFTELWNSVVDFNYSMSLGRPWLRDVKVTHDRRNNVIIVQSNGTIKTILVNKKLGIETRRPQVLICYDLMESLTDEEEDLIFETKPKLFSIGIIIFSNEKNSLMNVGVIEFIINGEFELEQGISNQGATKVVVQQQKQLNSMANQIHH